MTFNIRYGTAEDGANAWSKRREMVFDVLRTQGATVNPTVQSHDKCHKSFAEGVQPADQRGSGSSRIVYAIIGWRG